MVLSDKEMSAVDKDINKTNGPKIQPVEMQCHKCHKREFESIFAFNDHVLNCYGNT